MAHHLWRGMVPFLSSSIFLGLAACSPSQQADPRTEAPLVRTATAQPASELERSYTGTVVARVQSDLGFRVGGKIVERLVSAGQKVKRGQVLMRVDGADLSFAKVAQSRAVASAQAMAIQAEAEEKRLLSLVEVGAVSRSSYDQAKAASDSAKAGLSAAEARSSVAQNEAGYATLVAEADGVIVETLAEPGQVVVAGQTVLRLAQAGPREALVDLPETVRPQVGSLGQAVLYGNSKITGPAKLRQLSDSASPATRTYEARYVLQGSAAEAPLGSTISVLLKDASNGEGLQIPLAALLDAGQGPGVWVIEGEKPKVLFRKITVSSMGPETAVVTAGLKSGERFVALGAHLLHEGQLVRLPLVEGVKK